MTALPQRSCAGMLLLDARTSKCPPYAGANTTAINAFKFTSNNFGFGFVPVIGFHFDGDAETEHT